MAYTIRVKRGTAAVWTSSNPTLALGEVGLETDTQKFKFGTGTTAWNSLPYAAGASSGGGGSPASETAQGIAEIATQTETNAGTDDARMVTPLKLQTRLAAYAIPLSSLSTSTALGSSNTLVPSQAAVKGYVDGKTYTKADVGLGNVDNTADADKPPSDDTQGQLDQKAAIDHNHDTRYPLLTQITPTLIWKTGDATPSWVGGTRPAGLVVMFVVGLSDTLPSWKAANDIVYIVSASASGPGIRSFGAWTQTTADAGTTTCLYPSDIVDGDTLWLCVATSSTATPTTPTGWTVAEAFLSSGASNSDGLIIYTRTLTTGQAASLAGTSQSVTLGTSTAAVSTIVAWNGTRTIDTQASHVDDANTSTTQQFAALSPVSATPSTVVGVSALRFNTVTGTRGVGPRTGWTELFDRTTGKAGAPDRGLLFSVWDTTGAAGAGPGAASATASNVVRTAEYTISVI